MIAYCHKSYKMCRQMSTANCIQVLQESAPGIKSDRNCLPHRENKGAEDSTVLQKFMLPLRPAISPLTALGSGSLKELPPRFHVFAKRANDTLMARAGECATCRMRPGADSRGQLSPRCTTLHVHSSLCPVAGCARGCFPVPFPREEGEHSSLRPRLDAGRSAGGSVAPAGPAPIPAATASAALQSTAPGSLWSSSGEFCVPPGADSS